MILRDFHRELEKSSDKWDNYFSVYERHVFPVLMKAQPKAVLVEVGIQAGGSLDMWAEYTKHHHVEADIHGIDIDPSCALHDYSSHSNIHVHLGDQGNSAFWEKLLEKTIPEIDAFIDDGGHYMDQQITTIENVWPKIRPGGVYICEDTHTSYYTHNGGGYLWKRSFVEYIKNRIDDIHKHHISDSDYHGPGIFDDLYSLHVYNSIIVLEKNSTNYERPKRVFPSKFS